MTRFFFLLLLSGFYHGYGQPKQVTAIAFYNVENLFDTINDPHTDDDAFTAKGAYKYTGGIYRQKLHNIAYVIAQLGKEKPGKNPVMVGLAEVENKQVLEDLVQQPELKEHDYRYIHYNSPDPRGIDVALLYQPDGFTLLNSKPVSVLLDNDSITETTRDILFVTGLLNGDTVHLLVNHWPSRREGKGKTAPKRAQAAAANRHIIDSLLNQNSKSRVIIMGDLNDDPDDASVVNILGATKDKDPIDGNLLYNPWSVIQRGGKGTAAFRKKWNLFDQIILSKQFLKKDTGWQFYEAEIFDKDFLKALSGNLSGFPYRSWRGYYWYNGYSDHFPVILYLEK